MSDGRGRFEDSGQEVFADEVVHGVRISEESLGHGFTIKIGSTEMRFLAQ